MNNGLNKKILIVDDKPNMCQILKDRFMDCNKKSDSPYRFEVDVAYSAAECKKKVRKISYDVIVLDIRLELEEQTSGLDLNLVFALNNEVGWESPIRIIFTGYPSYRSCVESMRHGAWDYIIKEDVGDTPMAQIVLNSALSRLQYFDLREEQEKKIAANWLPQNIHELQQKYGGQIIAIWHRPHVEVIANGQDAFELEDKLKNWRQQHAEWEQPFIVEIPPEDSDGDEREE